MHPFEAELYTVWPTVRKPAQGVPNLNVHTGGFVQHVFNAVRMNVPTASELLATDLSFSGYCIDAPSFMPGGGCRYCEMNESQQTCVSREPGR